MNVSKRISILLPIICLIAVGLLSLLHLSKSRDSSNNEALNESPYQLKVVCRSTKDLEAQGACTLTDEQKKELSQEYEKGVYLFVTICPSEHAVSQLKGDIASDALAHGWENHTQVSEQLSYKLEQFTSLRFPEGRAIAPVQCAFVNNYGISKGCNQLLVVFPRQEIPAGAKDAKLVFSRLGCWQGNIEQDVHLCG